MNKYVFRCLLAAFGAGGGPAAYAQTPANPAQPWGSWFIATVQLPGDAAHKWGSYAEVQARTDAVFRHYFYNELKAGLSYDVDPNFTVLLGTGRYTTSDYRDLGQGPLNVEKRLWEQVVLTQFSHRLKLEHRYRIEQRWLRFRDDSTAFRQRFRYRLNAFFPLNKPTITAGTMFLSAYDEIFLNPNGPVFERNRLYAGVGYQANAHLILQVGFVNQANYNLPAYRAGQFVPQITSAKNNVVVALTYKLAYRAGAPAQEHLPSQQD
ncbi:DUF2490 domain-containing protein [Hymenobacter nivis]|uniref:DUF2490 domain-containing protein n=1 Tax=Hymenobacter nivis TaxID=1850093 RepID=A0A2Z3GV46_9BACT|nr:DUF2490 domain-containing protein [Hymenobacter nivis]AWM33294.1 DUF2490 domain-containing protein [Hymenobacter nivis]